LVWLFGSAKMKRSKCKSKNALFEAGKSLIFKEMRCFQKCPEHFPFSKSRRIKCTTLFIGVSSWVLIEKRLRGFSERSNPFFAIFEYL
jgi:hypothetical protein